MSDARQPEPTTRPELCDDEPGAVVAQIAPPRTPKVLGPRLGDISRVLGRFGRLAAVAASVFALVFPAAAAASSIAYVKDGNVWVAHPDGSAAVQLTADGGYESPTQADDGTIVALRPSGPTNGLFVRLRPDGTPANAPFGGITYDIPPSGAWTVFGPLQSAVSPDGSKIAYGWASQMGLWDPYCGCYTQEVAMHTSLTPADHYTDLGGSPSNGNSFWFPSWIGSSAVLTFGYNVFSDNVSVLFPGQPASSAAAGWFSDPDVMLQAGSLSRAGDKLVAETQPGDGSTPTIRLYSVTQVPTATTPSAAAPTFRCEIGTPAPVKLRTPSWAPDGSAFAYEAADGIHVVPVGDLGRGCPTAAPLVIPGGSFPAFGPAEPTTTPHLAAPAAPAPAAPAAPAASATTVPTAQAPVAQPGSVPAAADRLAPTLAGLHLAARTVRVGGTARVALALSEAGTVSVQLERRVPGVRHGTRCLAAGRSARGKRCTRTLSVGSVRRFSVGPGANRLAVPLRVGARRLAAGSYVAVVRATDAAGNRAAARTLALRVTR